LNLAETRLEVDEGACTECGLCVPACPVGALSLQGSVVQPHSGRLRSEYDVVVVGAGPGGSMAAWSAARDGARVLLLEKRQEIGSAVRCAEGVGHGPLSRFLAPDPRWISATVTSAAITIVQDSSQREVLRRSGSTGYILERRVFDRAVAEAAANAGAQVITKTPALGLIREGRQVVGVTVRHRGQTLHIGAHVVIAADGVESLVARWSGLNTALPPHDTMSCAQYLLAGIDVDPTCCAYFVGEGVAPGGYAWVFPKGEGRANVGLGVQADVSQRPALDYLEDFVAATPHLARGSIVTQIFGVVPVAPPLGRLVSDGLMVVGDAAHQVDPLTGGGITNAMTAGEIAGKVAAQACRHSDASAANLEGYAEQARAVLGRRLERNYRLKEKYGMAARVSEDFLKVFALAAAGS
jgi:digeranylgeranylglycerophospholipid reductase